MKFWNWFKSIFGGSDKKCGFDSCGFSIITNRPEMPKKIGFYESSATISVTDYILDFFSPADMLELPKTKSGRDGLKQDRGRIRGRYGQGHHSSGSRFQREREVDF